MVTCMSWIEGTGVRSFFPQFNLAPLRPEYNSNALSGLHSQVEANSANTLPVQQRMRLRSVNESAESS